MDAPIGRLDVAVFDCPDPHELAGFYQRIIGGTFAGQSDGWVEVHTDRGRVAFQQIDGHRRPTWPDGDVPQQAHIDVDVEDLDSGEDAVLAIGATKATVQPSPDDFRVFLDPAGHPFCLVAKASTAEK